jgi:hypothetical protein
MIGDETDVGVWSVRWREELDTRYETNCSDQNHS